MNLAFVLLDAGDGGHTRTATSIARALLRRGHRIQFVLGEHNRSAMVEAVGVPLWRVRRGAFGRWERLEEVLSSLHRENPLDAVHTFSRHGLPHLLAVCKRDRIPFAWTICGGVAAPTWFELATIRPIVSLSQEIKDQILRITHLDPDDILVVPARVDTEACLQEIAQGTPDDKARFLLKYGLSPTSRLVLRVARVHPDYEVSIREGADAVARLVRTGHDVAFVHLGFVQDRGCFSRLTDHFARINHDAGRTIAVTAQDEAWETLKYTGIADVVVGTGRTALEGMLAGKPTLVVGERGLAGLVTHDTVRTLLYDNFSGRTVAEPRPASDRVDRLTGEIGRLLEKPELVRSLAAFGHRFVMENLDAGLAAKQYEKLYRRLPGFLLPGRLEVWKLLLTQSLQWMLRKVLPIRVKRSIRATFTPHADA